MDIYKLALAAKEQGIETIILDSSNDKLKNVYDEVYKRFNMDVDIKHIGMDKPLLCGKEVEYVIITCGVTIVFIDFYKAFYLKTVVV